MERDFLGLGSKNVPLTVKEESTDGFKDSAPMRGSSMQWSFSNKVPAIHQFLSFTSGFEEKPRKSGHDPLTAPISVADAYDPNQKPYSSMIQKSLNSDKQVANNYVKTTYAAQNIDACQVHQPQQVRIFPVSNQQNQSITVSTSTSVLQSHVGSMGQNVVGNSMNSQTLGGVPITSPIPVHPIPSSIVGTTDLRSGSKSSGTPAQLTIFYAGSVCVYDDISPEKAQSIMLLAGHGSSSETHNKTVSTAQLQSPIPWPSVGDGYVRKQAHISSPCSGLPNPISLAASSTNELATVKSVGALASASNQMEPPKPVSSAGPSSATLIPSVALPQARQASLARFLEKRKERVLNSSPYSVSKKSPDCTATGSDGMSLSVSSFTSPTHRLAVKEEL